MLERVRMRAVERMCESVCEYEEMGGKSEREREKTREERETKRDREKERNGDRDRVVYNKQNISQKNPIKNLMSF